MVGTARMRRATPASVFKPALFAGLGERRAVQADHALCASVVDWKSRLFAR
ncbi:hypothetical protein LOC51_15725 [Rubrivivax sp. JA1024]|nr:hypothetical protein [Rubrivivax sp. JA1024]